MSEQNILDSVNRKIYARADVMKSMSQLDELFSAEKILFDKLLPKIANSDILDIGIGGGRTISYLLTVSPNYVGIDYVPEFVERARQKYPQAKFAVSDARRLSEFAAGSFDFALFSFNGIDYISHEDRLQALTQIRRVLKIGGTFMFSTHNRDYRNFNQPPWRDERQFSAQYFKQLAIYFWSLAKRRTMKKHEILTDEYAVINDCAYRFSLLTYYIGVAEQLAQLKKAEFKRGQAFNHHGAAVTSDAESLWVYYLAEK